METRRHDCHLRLAGRHGRHEFGRTQAQRKNFDGQQSLPRHGKISVSGAYTFDFANDFKNATVTGSSSDDTIIAREKNIFITGGAGADIFQFKSTGTIGDYDSEDKISLTGAASITTDGNDLIFNGKLTVTGGAEKSVTYLDADGRHTIEPAAKNFILSADGKSITLTDTYLDDDSAVAPTLPLRYHVPRGRYSSVT